MVSVRGLRTVGSAMREGPVWRRVSAMLRLISVTVDLRTESARKFHAKKEYKESYSR